MRAAGFDWRSTGGIPVLVPEFFDELNLRGGYSARASSAGRELDLDLRGVKPAAGILENRRLVCAAMGLEPDWLVLAEQVHGPKAAVVSRRERGRGAVSGQDVVKGVDALVTNQPCVALAALGADCPLVLLADDRRHAVASVHCGWRGTAAGVVGAALRALGSLDVPPESLYAAIGPSIGPCCYEVGREVRARFDGALARDPRIFAERGGSIFLDLREAIGRQLLDSGVSAARIFTAPFCTSCQVESFFSYRREGEGAGRCAGVIAICDEGE